jgi:hypothetical protein
MSAEAVGRHMPAIITLDDLATMIAADAHDHRYETSLEGALFVVPPPASRSTQPRASRSTGRWPVTLRTP